MDELKFFTSFMVNFEGLERHDFYIYLCLYTKVAQLNSGVTPESKELAPASHASLILPAMLANF